MISYNEDNLAWAQRIQKETWQTDYLKEFGSQVRSS